MGAFSPNRRQVSDFFFASPFSALSNLFIYKLVVLYEGGKGMNV